MERSNIGKRDSEAKKFIDDIQKKYGLSDDDKLITLLDEILAKGISVNEVNFFFKNNYSKDKRELALQYIRDGIPMDVIGVICRQENTKEMMTLARQYYEKGLPVSIISNILEYKQPAKVLEATLREISEKMCVVENTIPSDESEVKQMVEILGNKVSDIEESLQFMKDMKQSIDEFMCTKSNSENDSMAKKIEEQEILLSQQQQQLNEAKAAANKINSTIEENKKLKENLESNEKELMNMQAEMENYKKAVEERKKDAVMPMYYSIPIIDGNGRVIHYAPVESETKIKKSNITGLISKLCFRKKQKQDMVKILASGELNKEQLEQIKQAIIKGLSEDQIVNLISNKVDADKMEEIIEIAVLENSMN